MLAHGFEKTATEISGALLEDNRVHGIIFISSATIGVEPYEPLIDMVKEGMTKPVLFSLFGEKDKVDALTLLLDGHHIPAYLFPETASKVFANMYRHAFKTKQASGS
jgi:acyl-CoA synthetase (NDP forming)